MESGRVRCGRMSDWLKGGRVESDFLRAGGRGEGVESNWIRSRRLEFVQLKDRRAFNWLRCRRIESDWLAAAAAKSSQSCPTLCDRIDGSPPGSPIPGILQARTLEWVAISFSNA